MRNSQCVIVGKPIVGNFDRRGDPLWSPDNS